MALTIQEQLTKHEFADERRFGQMENHLTRIEGKIDLLADRVIEARRVADSASDEVEATGRHRSLDAEKRADFWKKVIVGVLSALFVGAVSGAVSYTVGARNHTVSHP